MEKIKRINQKWILIPKLLYFILSMFFYTPHQFRTPFILHSYGVSKKYLGNWISIAQLISFILNIVIGRFNDKSGKQRPILLSLIGASVLICHLFFFTNNSMTFWPLFFVYFSLLSATAPLLDKIVLDYLSNSPNATVESYGTQRIWSTIGYLCCNFILEGLIINTETKKDFKILKYYNMFTGIATMLAIYLFIHNLPPVNNNLQSNSALKRLFKNSEFMYFMLIILLSGIVRASMTLYLSDYMSDVLNLQKKGAEPAFITNLGIFGTPIRFFMKTKMSVTSAFGVMLEMIVFFNSKRIFNKLGLYLPLFIGCIAQLARFVGYYFLHYKNNNAFAICCALELLKGLIFGMFQTSATLLVGKLSPESIKTTTLIVFNGTYIALGTVFSGLIFGFVFDKNSKKPGLESYFEYKRVYMVNIVISIFIIIFVIWKYGIRENLLFNKANADAKLEKIEKDRQLEDLVEKKTNNGNVKNYLQEEIK